MAPTTTVSAHRTNSLTVRRCRTTSQSPSEVPNATPVRVRTVTATAFSLQTAGMDTDAQQPDAEAGKEHDVPGQALKLPRPLRRHRHDAERDQRVQDEEQKEGYGFKEYSHESDVVNILIAFL